VIKPQPGQGTPDGKYRYDGIQEGIPAIELLDANGEPTEKYFSCGKPRYEPGGIPWVRETWKPSPYEDGIYAYKADKLPHPAGSQYLQWRSPYHMPRAAARIFLRVAGVGVERVQDISEADARAEGITIPFMRTIRGIEHIIEYRWLWDKINGKRDHGAYAWKKNPWVWVIDFERVDDYEQAN
jgi:hypothetical protein